MSSPGIYESVMGSDSSDDGFVDPFDAPDTFGPSLTEEDFNALLGAPEPGATQRIGQGPLANKQLPIDDGNSKASRVVQIAKSFVGVPYQWGGMSPSGFDCSGILDYVFKKVGVNLPRLSADQARTGTRVALSDAQAGDIIGWDLNTRNNGADHVALYLGGGMILEAPRPGVPVRIRRLGNNEGAWATRVL